MKRFWILPVAALFLFGISLASGQLPAKKPAAGKVAARAALDAKTDETSKFMRLKLGYSQNVLEGVVMKDFDLIAKNAQAMALLTEDENWMLLQTPEYRTYSSEFKQIANRLTQAAKEKNLDGAALDYVQMTLNCVECHKHVREKQ
ncbi:MAG TPA: hypothetical protein VHB99_05745 [Pirellulales bacterium]|nr:hypothetical protein [Pirellulales bacterium]